MIKERTRIKFMLEVELTGKAADDWALKHYPEFAKFAAEHGAVPVPVADFDHWREFSLEGAE